MKDNIYIQEIEKFNDEISVWRLIDKHVKVIWWIGLFLPLFLLFGFSIPFVICKNYWLYSILLVLATGYAFFIVRCDCVGKKRKRIIQQQYPYAIQG